MRFKLLVIMSLILLLGCKAQRKDAKPALDISNMDRSVKPGDDFFSYANGNWVRRTTIPSDKSRYGSFDILQEENNQKLKEILERAAAEGSHAVGSNWQKVGDFYSSGMNVEEIDRKGIEPIKTDFERINAISNQQELIGTIAHLHSMRVAPVFFIYAGQDRRNSTQVVLILNQGGLGLPDRDYYLTDDVRAKEIRQEYGLHLSKVFTLLGYSESEASQNAAFVLEIETRLAGVSLTRLERRDPSRTYNKMTANDLQSISSSVDWNSYFNAIGINNPSDLVIDNPAFFREFSNMLSDVPLSSWKSYLLWSLVNRFSPYLSKPLVEQQFHFYGKVLSGNEEIKPRWEYVASSANSVIGELVGQIYVEENFPPQAKEEMVTLVSNLKSAYRDRIENINWMSDATKARALAKLDAMNVKVGYPDKWRDYSGLEIVKDCYLTNVRRGFQFAFRNNLDKIGKPVDRTEWFMNPQTVNAYYSSTMNEIVFPAAILQPPFFNLYADDAVNYGAIGMVIGHEMTHGFDDQGRKFDKDGNLFDWWEPEDAEKFNNLTQTLIDQYEAFVVLDSLNLNGKLTLGENLADYGGLTIAYHALQRSFITKPKPGLIDGYTPEQRFFISYANIWRQLIRDKELMRRVKEGPHSPGMFRVNGALFNINEFYDAFDIDPTDPLYRAPELRPTIW